MNLNVSQINRQVVAVEREKDPLTEWNQNGDIIAGALSRLFMTGGNMLPKGTWSPELIRHLMWYYDERFEKNTMFIAALFNQLQRHTSVKRAAKIGSTQANVLTRLGNLANSDSFRECLIKAIQDPNVVASKRLNASLLHLLSTISECVPFSPFEWASTRPKLNALRYRYGVANIG